MSKTYWCHRPKWTGISDCEYNTHGVCCDSWLGVIFSPCEFRRPFPPAKQLVKVRKVNPNYIPPASVKKGSR